VAQQLRKGDPPSNMSSTIQKAAVSDELKVEKRKPPVYVSSILPE
jgi:hypothetical protein